MHFTACIELDHRFLYNISKRLNQVKGQRGLIIQIRMENSNVGIQLLM